MPKVLVIDDSVSVRKVVERALAGRQIEVVCAASGSEALECMERDVPDVIVCDVVMPDRDGYEICEFVKNHPRLGETPVLLMSGIVNDEVRQRAARARSEGVLSKPFAAEDLLKRLDRFLGPLAPRVPDAAASTPAADPLPPKAAAPAARIDGTPTLMPVSTLTLGPVDGPKPEPALASPPPPPPVAPPAPLMVTPPPPPPVLTPPAPAEPAVAVVTPNEPVRPAVEPVATAPAPPPIVTPPSLPDAAAGILAQFTAMDGVQWAVLSDREGFVVEATTNAGVDADVAAALSACLAESSDGLGRELGRGALQSLILEYEKGMVVVYGAGTGGLLAVGLAEPAVLGKVRYFAKKTLPELTRSL